MEMTNHSTSKLAQYAFLVCSEQLAGASSKRDWTSLSLAFSSRRSRCERVRALRGGWGGEREATWSQIRGQQQLFRDCIRAANLSAMHRSSEIYKTRNRKHAPRQFLLSLNSPGCATFVQ